MRVTVMGHGRTFRLVPLLRPAWEAMRFQQRKPDGIVGERTSAGNQSTGVTANLRRRFQSALRPRFPDPGFLTASVFRRCRVV